VATLKTGKIRREISKLKLDINFMTQQSAVSLLIPKLKEPDRGKFRRFKKTRAPSNQKPRSQW
jgi:hypothetical protein